MVSIDTFLNGGRVDQNRDVRYTNRLTVADLFPNENPVDAEIPFTPEMFPYKKKGGANS